MDSNEQDRQFMTRALELAVRGQGLVEPNPMVGCVIVSDGRAVGEGFHTAFGKPHAEIEALQQAGNAARGATLFVTLEPCCHQGKTPPCTEAILDAGVARVVVATTDPYSEVDGGGLDELKKAGVAVELGVMQFEARQLNAPYFKRLETGRPWVIAKWAMTADGKIATETGDSRWISNAESRKSVHQLRGRVDAILIGSGTAAKDDPLLTARPPGSRRAVRIIADSHASLALDSQLVTTARNRPVLVAASHQSPEESVKKLIDAGCEVMRCDGESHQQRLIYLLDQCGQRGMTNILVEGGAKLLGTLFDADAVDEVHVFVAPKIVGGLGPSAVAGRGASLVADAKNLEILSSETHGGDVHVVGRIRHSGSDESAEIR